jgi:hypothetical protein
LSTSESNGIDPWLPVPRSRALSLRCVRLEKGRPPLGSFAVIAPVSPHHPSSVHWQRSPRAVLSAGANSVPMVDANTGQLPRFVGLHQPRCVRPTSLQSQMTLSWLFVLTRHTVSSRKRLPDVDQPCVSILDSSFAVRMMIAVVRSTAICMFSGLNAPSPTW